MRNSVVPFLNISRWPEEDGISPAEPPHPAVPRFAEESIFSRSDPELALIIQISRDAEGYTGLESNNKRHHFLRQVVSTFLEDPLKFEAYADELSRMQESGDENLSLYKSALFENLRLSSMQPDRYSEASLGGWLELMVRRLSYRDQGAAVLNGMFTATRTEKEVVNYLYTLSKAGLSSGMDRDDPEVIRLLAEILNFEHGVLNLHSRHHHTYWMAMYSPDDETLKRRFEVGSAQSYLGQHFASAVYDRVCNCSSIFDKWPETVQRIRTLAKQDTKRLLAINRFLEAETTDSPFGLGFVTYPAEILNSWPANFIFVENGCLRDTLNEFATREKGDIISVWLPGRGNMILDCSNGLADYIATVLSTETPENGAITRRDGVAALYALTPELTKDQHHALSEDARLLRQRIYQEQQRYVSPTGDRIVIEDPLLKKLGFESILFEEGNPRIQTDVTIRVANFEFKLTLDRKHNLREFDSERGFPVASFKRGFFEQVVLGHFHALVCGDNLVVNHRREGGSCTNGEEAKRAFNGMRGHRRKLPPGFCFSAEQAKHYADEKDGDLRRLNQEHGLTRETGQITYVKAKNPPNGKKLAPFKLTAKDACARLREFVPEHFTVVEQLNTPNE